MKLVGKAVSKGVVIGKVLVFQPFKPEPALTYIEKENVQDILTNYEQIKLVAESELDALFERMNNKDSDKAAIFKAHREILNDPEIDDSIKGLIENDLLAPEAAIAQTYDSFILLLSKSKNKMMRERASDLSDVKYRLLRCWQGVEERNLSSLTEPVIVVADDLFPSDTVSMDRENVIGIATQIGGSTSHTAIIAKSYEIPAVLGIDSLLSRVQDGDAVILDAISGELITNPTQEDYTKYKQLREKTLEEQAFTRTFLNTVAETADGHRVAVRLNLAAADDLELQGAPYTDGCGLFRTEFLYLDSDHLPDEEEQFQKYKKAVQAFEGKPVTLRTLDIGGDKQMAMLNLPQEHNPFLGVRGLRLCLVNKHMFRTQIRAALRASSFGNLRIMMPMVASLDEYRRAKSLIREWGEELDEEGISWNKDIKIGIMIEIPSIALIADLLAPEVDFVSIGSNDLCQYLTASDRINPAVKPYYQDYHPSMFRLMGYVAKEFKKYDKYVSVCGELGGDPLAIPVLIGLGIDILSMGLSSVAMTKKWLRDFTYSEAVDLAEQVQQLKTNSEIKARLEAFYEKHAQIGH